MCPVLVDRVSKMWCMHTMDQIIHIVTLIAFKNSGGEV